MYKRTVEQGYVWGMGMYRDAYYKVYKVLDHYELHINGEFWSSGDSIREVHDELESVREMV